MKKCVPAHHMMQRNRSCLSSGIGGTGSSDRSATARHIEGGSDSDPLSEAIDAFRRGKAGLPVNIKNVVALARDADQLFIEAPFLDVDAKIAAERQHLTAQQAGHIAKQARVGRLIPFHFSARYRDRAEELTREAIKAFSVSESPELSD